MIGLSRAMLRRNQAPRSDKRNPKRSQYRKRLWVEGLERRCVLAANQFAVIGDYGRDGPAEQAVAEMVKSWDPAIVVTLGDNNYPDGAAETIDANIGKHYQEFIGNYQGSYGPGSAENRFFPSLGNHDWETPGAQPYLDYFTLPGNERYYDFVWGPIHFFALDSDVREPDGRTSTSVQAQWLESALANSTSPFQVVYMHHAPYSSSSGHGGDPGMQWPFKEWGADVVMTGHDHVYERLDIAGIPFFVNGLGGASITGFSTPVEGSQVRYNDDHGAMLVTAEDNELTFEFLAVANGGELIDRFVVSANSNVEETLVPAGSAWKYYDAGNHPGTGWQGLSFPDTAWATGTAELGYGDGDESTVVSYGANANSKHITTYFRDLFQVAAADQYSNLWLYLRRDDGAVVYLNGQEVLRSNMPSGTIGYDTFASSVVGGDDESLYVIAPVPVDLLVDGTNVLAVEVHQANDSSSDISFDLKLTATVSTSEPLTVTSTNDSGPGSLREALLAIAAANSGDSHTAAASTVASTVRFEIPGSGPHVIQLNSELPAVGQPVRFEVPDGKTVQVGTTGRFSLGDYVSLTKTGEGTLTLDGNHAPSSSAMLVASAGTLNLRSDAGSQVSLIANSDVHLQASQHLAALHVGEETSVELEAGTGMVLVVDDITVNSTGVIDLHDNALVVQPTAAERQVMLDYLTDLIVAGANGLQWNGNGMTSSSAASDPSLLTALGIMLNDNGLGGPIHTNFAGQPVDVNSILVSYTYYGDADLNSVVDGTDYALIDNGFNVGLTHWFDGDFSFDRIVDGTDYALIDNAFNAQSGPLVSPHMLISAQQSAEPMSTNNPWKDTSTQSASEEPQTDTQGGSALGEMEEDDWSTWESAEEAESVSEESDAENDSTTESDMDEELVALLAEDQVQRTA